MNFCRPTVAGIHGNDVEGCYSLALSGGYEDDLDYGVCFTYTGEGTATVHKYLVCCDLFTQNINNWTTFSLTACRFDV